MAEREQQEEADKHPSWAPPLSSLKYADDAVEVLKRLHPGHVLTCASVPLLAIAYRDYTTPLESLVRAALQRQRVPLQDWEGAEESVRRSVASAVASRALRVATYGSCGTFGLGLAIAYYASGCDSTDDAVRQTREWALRARRRLDSTVGVSPASRMDEDHPEVRAIRGMTEAEEMSHMHRTYFSDFDSLPEDTSESSGRRNSR